MELTHSVDSASAGQDIGRPSTAPNIQGSMKLPDGFLESRKLLRALQKVNRNVEGRLNRIGYTSDGKHSVPILERARRAYYPAGNVITEEMQSTGDLGDCSTEFEMKAAREAAMGQALVQGDSKMLGRMMGTMLSRRQRRPTKHPLRQVRTAESTRNL